MSWPFTFPLVGIWRGSSLLVLLKSSVCIPVIHFSTELASTTEIAELAGSEFGVTSCPSELTAPNCPGGRLVCISCLQHQDANALQNVGKPPFFVSGGRRCTCSYRKATQMSIFGLQSGIMKSSLPRTILKVAKIAWKGIPGLWRAAEGPPE